MNKILMSMLFLVFITFSLFSTEEGYFGKFHSIRGAHDLQFSVDETGIESLTIDDLEYDRKKLSYEFPARYGGAQLLFIDFTDYVGYENTLKIFIVMSEGKFILATGYYLRSKWRNDQVIIENKGTFDLEFSPDEQ